jgi:alpha-N-arabinofuranosidase
VPLVAVGIDPSLFFDDDGTAYLCTGGEVGGHKTERGRDHGGDANGGGAGSSFGITLSIVDPDSGEILEGPWLISRGSGGRWPEGPHLYKRRGVYYLLMAEGGTEYGHMATVFRAASPWGPYEPCPRNPVLSHRDRGSDPIQCVGHGDIVEDGAGNSWLLCLGVRPLGPLLHNLGRETFLSPLVWDAEGWPVIGDNGALRLEMEGPLPGSSAEAEAARPGSRSSGLSPVRPRSSDGGLDAAKPIAAPSGWRDEFRGPTLSPEWSSLRGRPAGMAEVAAGGGLWLSGAEAGLSDGAATPAFLGRPQEGFDCIFEASLEFEPEREGAEAGVAAYYDDSYHYEAFVTKRSGSRAVCLRKRVHDIIVEVASQPIAGHGPVRLSLAADRERYTFYYSCGDSSGTLGSGMTAGLCTEGTRRMTFTGVFFGLYCVRGRAFFRDSSCVDRR